MLETDCKWVEVKFYDRQLYALSNLLSANPACHKAAIQISLTSDFGSNL